MAEYTKLILQKFTQPSKNASKILRTHLVFCLPKPAVDKSKPLPWEMPTELGGPKGAEPTRFGTWENKGREIDF